MSRVINGTNCGKQNKIPRPMRPAQKPSAATTTVLDTFGMAASSLCAVHCLLVPFVVAALPLMAGRVIEADITHQILSIFVVAFALAAIIPGYFKHGNKLVLAAAGLGLSLVLFATFDKTVGSAMELALMTTGNFMMLSTHFINRRLAKCAC